MKPKKVIIPIASQDFDPSEVAIPWQIIHDFGTAQVIRFLNLNERNYRNAMDTG